MIRRSFVIGALIAVVASAPGCGASHLPGKKVIVLGLDGMDYRVTRELMVEGRMPHFARLAAAGASPLATSAPPQSPVAWSSFITGLTQAATASSTSCTAIRTR